MRAYLSNTLVIALVLAAFTGEAFAKKRDTRERINHAVDDACKVVNATKQQKAQAHAAVAGVISAAEAAFGVTVGPLPEREELLKIFLAPKVDVQALQKIRTKRDERDARLADSLVRAFVQIHGILDRDQRALLAAYVQKKVQSKSMTSFKKAVVTAFLNTMVENYMDEIGAGEAERQVVRQSRDNLMSAMFTARGDAAASAATLSAIFVPDELDRGALDAFRKDREDKVRALSLAVQQTIVDVHDGVTPEHRLSIANIARSRSKHPAQMPVQPAEPAPTEDDEDANP